MKYQKVLVAGATGYLGKYILRELKKQGYFIIAIARDPAKLNQLSIDRIIHAEVTQPESLKGLCSEVDCVISTVGITRQKDGLLYMDVDYQANANLLKEAEKSGVKKFIYVSVLNGPRLRHLKMIEAKEKFVEELKRSGVENMIVRPNGFYSDMTEILKMAQKGKIYLFGDGEFVANPIHGADLARYIIINMEKSITELEIGGPDILSQNEIARMAFNATGNKERIIHLPIWFRDAALSLIHRFISQKTYGPIEFFMTVMTMDMYAPFYGEYRLEDYFNKVAEQIEIQ